ncbi:polyprenyl synthetase family protein [Streptomonospora nanhaiensis]|uniref:Heptaprenyl diphosphate synthase n=1 Tax=Streptomonospora nanhaiensis TaxID=1323731 RepID=A0A853BP07_9ACTN|nr:polyprenyl synthetase family protein [Streptomonospora nanhaiensis]MBV2361806.1 polyprenyl synthetase family protein [Streptomonospora nanhaiensis]MBX9387982.1 polyprenyl synthetase family protein [Streptomonospora nanhaiensis]NYI96376.1 heptaprenyl diphosphate synthase [Streptomonospora nanhaiensis]
MSGAVPSDFLALPSIDAGLAKEVQEALDQVEKLLRESVAASDPLLTEAASHLLSAGGKRFRATLVLLASHFGDPTVPDLTRAAAVVELTHVATLYHDDVMDEAELRRGEPSANQRWGNSVAILTGDYVFARASEILADLGTEAVRMQARTFGRLVQGQILETSGPRDGADPLEHYLRVISDKTASLIASSAEFGATFAGAGPEVTGTITRACDALGMAFQLADDILDVAGDPSESGKVPGTDLREGVLTLPMLYARRAAQAGDTGSARLDSLLGRPLSDAETEEALGLLRVHPAMDEARATTREWAERARAELAALPEGAPRDAFEALCDYVVRRSG